jgi:hypothetical protein
VCAPYAEQGKHQAGAETKFGLKKENGDSSFGIASFLQKLPYATIDTTGSCESTERNFHCSRLADPRESAGQFCKMQSACMYAVCLGGFEELPEGSNARLCAMCV